MIITAPMSEVDQKRASPDRLLFGATTIDVMPVNGTEICMWGSYAFRAEPRARTPEDIGLARSAMQPESALTACRPC
jgi:hypothetical protein